MDLDESLQEYFESTDQKLGDIVGERIFPLTHDGFMVVKNLWYFKFYNYLNHSNKKLLKAFKYCVKAKEIDPKDKGEMMGLIKNAAKRQKLKGCYRGADNDLNDTSLMAYHGPLSRVESKPRCLIKRKSAKPPFAINYQLGSLDKCSPLLMGDASIKNKKNLWILRVILASS